MVRLVVEGQETVEFSAARCVIAAMRSLAIFALLACLLAGCSSTTTFRARGVDLGKYHRLWVEQDLADDHRLDEMIAAELRALGYEVGTGPSTMMPTRGIEAIVTYNDEWTWDFKTYLIDIEITVQEPKSPRVIARGRYFRPGITGKSPEAMVHDVVRSVFKQGKK